jgi:hypothetical protein
MQQHQMTHQQQQQQMTPLSDPQQPLQTSSVDSMEQSRARLTMKQMLHHKQAVEGVGAASSLVTSPGQTAVDFLSPASTVPLVTAKKTRLATDINGPGAELYVTDMSSPAGSQFELYDLNTMSVVITRPDTGDTSPTPLQVQTRSHTSNFITVR